jgi:hypothetical protein
METLGLIKRVNPTPNDRPVKFYRNDSGLLAVKDLSQLRLEASNRSMKIRPVFDGRTLTTPAVLVSRTET